MHHFEYHDDKLWCEGVPLAKIAEEVGTPAYVYSHATLERHFQAFDGAFQGIPHLTCFSVKANSNLAILKLFANLGGGVDIVSGGELFRALRAGVSPKRIVFSGVGKTREEMRAALQADILMFNMESAQELDVLNEVAGAMGQRARVSFRINPDVDPQTHPYISTGLKSNKFGIAIDTAVSEYRRAAAMPNLDVVGLDCHIGSQLTQVAPFVDAVKRLRLLLDRLRAEGVHIKYLDIGGGLGITYDAEAPPAPVAYAQALKNALEGLDLTMILEPGRVIVGNAGILLTRVVFTKKGAEKDFVIVDGGMNDLMRPSLYGSYHAIWPVVRADRAAAKVDVVGPICESSDFLAKGRELPQFQPSELMAVMSAGAYGFSMSSNYNSRRRPAEVLVRGDEYTVIRTRETNEDLIRGETIPAFLQGSAW